ncbi:MAG: LamG domain-containing protein [Rhodospirillales bacterium]
MFRYLFSLGLILSISAPALAQTAACDAQLNKAHQIEMQRMAMQADKIKQSVTDATKAGAMIGRIYFGYINALVRRGNDPKNVPCVIGQLSEASNAAQKAAQVAAVLPKRDTAPAVAGVKLFPAAMNLQKGKVIAPPQNIRHGMAFGYGFWINPQAPLPGWSSILHKGRNDQERGPGIFFHPKSTRLHVRLGTEKSWNDGCDSKAAVPPQRWTHVFVQFRPGVAEIYLNGRLDNRCPIGKQIKINSGPLFAASPWIATAVASIRDVQLFTQPLAPQQVMGLMKPGS